MTTNLSIHKKKCSICNKKVTFDGWSCKCNSSLILCDKHRLPFEHNCSINYLSQNIKKLEMNNIKVIQDKIENRV